MNRRERRRVLGRCRYAQLRRKSESFINGFHAFYASQSRLHLEGEENCPDNLDNGEVNLVVTRVKLLEEDEEKGTEKKFAEFLGRNLVLMNLKRERERERGFYFEKIISKQRRNGGEVNTEK